MRNRSGVCQLSPYGIALWLRTGCRNSRKGGGCVARTPMPGRIRCPLPVGAVQWLNRSRDCSISAMTLQTKHIPSLSISTFRSLRIRWAWCAALSDVCVHRSEPRRPTRPRRRRIVATLGLVSIDQSRVGRRGTTPSGPWPASPSVHRSEPRRPTRRLEVGPEKRHGIMCPSIRAASADAAGPGRGIPDQGLRCPSIRAASADAAVAAVTRTARTPSVHRSEPRRPTRRSCRRRRRR